MQTKNNITLSPTTYLLQQPSIVKKRFCQDFAINLHSELKQDFLQNEVQYVFGLKLRLLLNQFNYIDLAYSYRTTALFSCSFFFKPLVKRITLQVQEKFIFEPTYKKCNIALKWYIFTVCCLSAALMMCSKILAEKLLDKYTQ